MVKYSTLSEIISKNDGVALSDFPYLTKEIVSAAIGKKEEALNYWIKRLRKTGDLISLKKNLYISTIFMRSIKNQPALFDRYREYLAQVIRQPSYLSLEYVLAKNNIIEEIPFALTSITLKSSRRFTCELGTFMYRNMNRVLFTGYRESYFLEKRYYTATPIKALFDYLYLKNLGRSGIADTLTDDMRINWDAFKKTDRKEFEQYVLLSKQKKMEKIMNIIITRNLI